MYYLPRKKKGFTLIELLVTVAIIAILAVVALPNINSFISEMRIDNEVSETQRLLLTARNTAINTGKNTTVCPLNSLNVCSNSWEDELSVFTNASNDTATNMSYDPINDEKIKVKQAINPADSFIFPHNYIIYNPSGQLATNSSGSFQYCITTDENASRGIDVSSSGRSYLSSDIDNDGKEENRAGTEISCD